MMMNKTDFTFIRYSNGWEDTEIVLNGLCINKGDTGISVASAGDNTLAMLIYEPERIYAFDVNETQLFCCELKMACFKSLSYKETLILLGVCQGDRIPLYRKVRNTLSEKARKYFDENIGIIENGIIHVGKFERFFGIFRKFIIPLFSTNKKFRYFSAIDNTEKQWKFYKKHICNRRLNAIFKVYFGYRVMGKLGRDERFYDYVDDKEESGNDIKGRFEFGIKNTANAYNPYVNYIINGRYSKRSLPFYLRRENYEKIKKNIDRITLINGDLTSLGGIKADFANLSDIFEYMSEKEFSENKTKLSEIMNENGRIAYFNMQNRRYIDSNVFVRNKTLSEQLFRRNKSWFYRDFLVYSKTEK